MNRAHALILIANQLDFLNGKFKGMKEQFTEEELKKADVILTTLEEAGIVGNYEIAGRAFWDEDRRSGAV